MIYLDQAASSFPKPQQVLERMTEAMKEYTANPGRSGHQLAQRANQVIFETRVKLANNFGLSDPSYCAFFLNATIALNQAIKGINWCADDHIITTSFEHNSIRRPVEYVKEKFGVRVTYINYDGNDKEFIRKVTESLTVHTKLIAMTHASNVTGIILPVQDVIKEVKKHSKAITLVDASQTAGHMEIHMKEQQIDLLALPAHKGLLGPQGVGVLLNEGNIHLEPIHHGGTGAFSEEINQPEKWPERVESGTLNTPGIAGLLGALECYEDRKKEIVPRETKLVKSVLAGLRGMENVEIYDTEQTKHRLPIVAFNVKNIPSQEIAMILDSHYHIAVRAGLHCSPLAHETLNTMDQGVVRVSFNMFNTNDEIDTFLQAMKDIAQSY